MPEGRGSTKAKKQASRPPKPKAESNGTPPEPEMVEQPNGIIVLREYDGDNLNVSVQRLGDLKVGELLTVLEVALRQARAQIGL